LVIAHWRYAGTISSFYYDRDNAPVNTVGFMEEGSCKKQSAKQSNIASGDKYHRSFYFVEISNSKENTIIKLIRQ